jgi:hypothetical protein
LSSHYQKERDFLLSLGEGEERRGEYILYYTRYNIFGSVHLPRSLVDFDLMISDRVAVHDAEIPNCRQTGRRYKKKLPAQVMF